MALIFSINEKRSGMQCTQLGRQLWTAQNSCRLDVESELSKNSQYWDKFANLATDPAYIERQARGPLVVCSLASGPVRA
jgi:hypothetical protein